MNKLANERSPYLLEHADDPVDWHPWNDETLRIAAERHMPLFVSIGYSSCHWCHVMQRESFKHKKVADILNSFFLCVKVDREERPDIDTYFQEMYSVMTGRGGGWPLSLFLTHEREPFYAATYMPPFTKRGLNGLYDVAEYIKTHYSSEYDKILSVGRSAQAALQQNNKYTKTDADSHTSHDIAQRFKTEFLASFDKTDGGFGAAPKFPHVAGLRVALALSQETGDTELSHAVHFTLTRMIQGGFYDLVEGGFCRYSTDDWWLVPHFEKMCYDNALLAELYLHAYASFQEERFLEVALDTIAFMEQSIYKNGLFISAIDADSNGEEGSYYVYSYAEMMQDTNDDVRALFEVSRFGNFEGKNIVRLKNPLTPKSQIAEYLQRLIHIRHTRTRPHTDDKSIVMLNAMAIHTYLSASLIEPHYYQKATNTISTLLSHLYIDGTLYRYTINNERSRINAYLEDYAYLAHTLVYAYEIGFDDSFLHTAVSLMQTAVSLFFHDNCWYNATGDYRRECDIFDAAIPSVYGILLDTFDRLVDIGISQFTHIADSMTASLAKEFYAHPFLASETCYALLRRGGHKTLLSLTHGGGIRYADILLSDIFSGVCKHDSADETLCRGHTCERIIS